MHADDATVCSIRTIIDIVHLTICTDHRLQLDLYICIIIYSYIAVLFTDQL